MTSMSTLSEDEVTILKMRAGINMELPTANICHFHENKLGEKFENEQTKCCNLFNKHAKKKKKIEGTHKMTLKMAQVLQSKDYTKAVPGKKFCRNCYDVCKSMCDADAEDTEETSEGNDEDTQYEVEMHKQEVREKLNESLGAFDISPLKTHGMQKRTQVNSAKEKLDRSFEKQKDAVKDILEIQTPELGSGSRVPQRELETKAADLDRLVDAMTEKLKKPLSTSEKITLMTLAPESWSRQQVSKYFGVSEYVVWEARSLKEKKGIISVPDKRIGRGLSEEVINSVKAFYEDDEFSRMMPGGRIL